MSFFDRPGFRTSEFKTAVLNAIVQVALAWHGAIANGTAENLTVAGAVAFILSRGLAKLETRPPVLTKQPAEPTA